MLKSAPRLPFTGVVLVADLMKSGDGSELLHLRCDLEQTDATTLGRLQQAIESFGLQFFHYESPGDLALNCQAHRDHVVLTIFGGSSSRNRMALVPAVCESVGIRYVGPDTYGRIICQDKEVSKSIAVSAGLQVANHRIIRSENDIDFLTDFPLPYVTKPVMEGSSIGIGPKSLIRVADEGKSVALELLRRFKQPVMVESFVAGREVSYCFIQANDDSEMRSLAEVVWNGQDDYFDSHLYDASHKGVGPGLKSVRVISDQLPSIDRAAIERLLDFTGPLGYGRVDGKLNQGRFTFLEITPDAWLGESGSFMQSFTSLGMTFEEVTMKILLSKRSAHQGQ